MRECCSLLLLLLAAAAAALYRSARSSLAGWKNDETQFRNFGGFAAFSRICF
jgi:hypothetical protein